MITGGALAFVAAALAVVASGMTPFAQTSRPADPEARDMFSCPSPQHHDGDAIRCGSKGRSDRLYAIDAPEMPGACRPGRQCTPGDPFAARDHLRELTAGKPVACQELDRDRYGRRILRCFVGGVDLSCAMVRDGFAVERYGRMRCR